MAGHGDGSRDPGQRILGRNVPELSVDRLQATEDDREQVVEVVGDAAGQLADRVHLLCLAQLVLRRLPLCQLLGDAGFERVGQRAQFGRRRIRASARIQ